MYTTESMVGALVYLTISMIWYSPLFFGSVLEGGANNDAVSVFKNRRLIFALIVSAFLFNFCLSKLISYTNLSPYIISLIIWVGGFLPPLIFALALKKVNAREVLVHISGFLINLIGVATSYVIW